MISGLARWTAIIIFMIAARPAHIDAATLQIHLVNQRGAAFRFDDLRGASVVLTFISAHCTDACPLINAQIAQTVRELGHNPRAVRFLTVTLDPERDSATDMRRLAKQFQADPSRWIVASGNTSDVHALMRRYQVVTQRDAQGYATSHTTFVYILDTHLQLRRTLLASSDLSEQLLHEVTQ